MNAEMVSRTISLILAPAVLITTCAILLNGLHSHYSAISSQLRLLARERLDLLQAARPMDDALKAERLWEIDAQAPDLLRRHKLIHDAILVLYCAILIFLASMFVIAAATRMDWLGLAMAVLLTFLSAVGIMLFGVLLVTLEVRVSHRAVHYEMERVLKIGSEESELRAQNAEFKTEHV